MEVENLPGKKTVPETEKKRYNKMNFFSFFDVCQLISLKLFHILKEKFPNALI